MMVSIPSLGSVLSWVCKEFVMQVGKRLIAPFTEWFMPRANAFLRLFVLSFSWNGARNSRRCPVGAFAHNRALFIQRNHVAEALVAATQKLGCSVLWAPANSGKTFTVCNHFVLPSSSNTSFVRIDWTQYKADVDMERWMVAHIPHKNKKNFTVLFMDHYDTTMENGHTRASMKFMSRMMRRSSQQKNFTIIVAVNSVLNANTMRNWLSDHCETSAAEKQAFRHILLGSEPHQSLRWEMSADAIQFARAAYSAMPEEDVESLDWGQDAGDSEQRIGKLVKLILLDGSVHRTISFLHDGLDTGIDVYLHFNASKMRDDWNDGFVKISDTYYPRQQDLKLFPDNINTT